jgi:hypothetical protein
MPSENAFYLSREQLTRLVSGLTGLAGYPNPDDPLPPGPWDPVLKNRFLDRYDLVLAGPQPQPWRQRVSSLDWVSLNPQPLPPRISWAQVAARAIVSEIRSRMALMQSLPEEFHGRMVEGIHANMGELVADWCGTEPRRWPIPIPIPPWPWPPDPDPDPRELLVNPLDLLIMGVVFESLVNTVDEEVQGVLLDTAAAFQDAGFGQL